MIIIIQYNNALSQHVQTPGPCTKETITAIDTPTHGATYITLCKLTTPQHSLPVLILNTYNLTTE